MELAKANHDLILAARRKDRLEEQAATLSKAHGVDVQVVAVDLGRPGGAQRLIDEAVYSATKSYVLSFSEAVHYELQGTGVSITTSCPGLTDTEFHDVANHQKPGWMKSVTMTAEEVARISLRAMFNGKRTVIPGVVNWISAVTSLRTPKFIVIPMAARMMRKP